MIWGGTAFPCRYSYVFCSHKGTAFSYLSIALTNSALSGACVKCFFSLYHLPCEQQIMNLKNRQRLTVYFLLNCPANFLPVFYVCKCGSLVYTSFCFCVDFVMGIGTWEHSCAPGARYSILTKFLVACLCTASKAPSLSSLFLFVGCCCMLASATFYYFLCL